MARKIVPLIFALSALPALLAAAPSPQVQPTLSILDSHGNVISRLTDGDSIRLQIRLSTPAEQPVSVSFAINPDKIAVAECTVAKRSDTCQTDPFPALGWFWDKNRQPQSHRTVSAGSAATPVQVAPRPVVFVHGFGSSAEAWTTYLGDTGLLALIGLRGFAVGDGQVPGRLALGDLANPTAKTGTIHSNAETLRDYIAAVKQLTGAQMVDLVAHSMGNLVSRYYIDRVMPGRDVAQMIMLGPPNLGTDCAYLPSSLGYYLPAALEIRPSYVRHIFNPQITKRHGVPFTILAGTPIVQQVGSPCTQVPSDLAIALASASGIRAPVTQSGIWHGELNTSPQVFEEFVKPLLQKTAGDLAAEPDPPTPIPADQELQFTRVFTGHVDLGTSTTRTINIDNVTVASFALFDPTRSLTVTVRGATGNIIALDPVRNGLIVVQDPATLVYLGYGFNNPRPGPWQVTLQTTDATPRGGADYALTAQLQGGAVLITQASNLLPRTAEPVQLASRLELAGQLLPIGQAQARIRYPDGQFRDVALAADGAEWRSSWTPGAPGLYGVDVTVNGTAPDGTPIERSTFLSVEVQPGLEQFQSIQMALALGAGLLLILLTGWVGIKLWRTIRRTRAS